MEAGRGVESGQSTRAALARRRLDHDPFVHPVGRRQRAFVQRPQGAREPADTREERARRFVSGRRRAQGNLRKVRPSPLRLRPQPSKGWVVPANATHTTFRRWSALRKRSFANLLALRTPPKSLFAQSSYRSGATRRQPPSTIYRGAPSPKAASPNLRRRRAHYRARAPASRRAERKSARRLVELEKRIPQELAALREGRLAPQTADRVAFARRTCKASSKACR
jgi:hypothetical protein